MTGRMGRALWVILAAWFLTAPAEAADKASLRLEFRLTGFHLPFYWAKEKGYYAQEGIDLEIKEGAGSPQTVNLMGTNQDTFGFADYTIMARAIAQGMSVKGIYGIVQKSPWAVISYQDKAIRKPQDLAGKSLALLAGHKALMEHFMRINNVPPESVSLRVVSASVRNTTFAHGTVDSFVSIVIGSPLDFVVLAKEGKGKPVHFMNFPEFGVDHLAYGILAHHSTLQEKPDLVKRFLRATAKGWTEAPKHVDEALQIGLKHSPAAKERAESVKLQFLETLPRMRTAATEGKPIGWMSESDWKNTQDLLVKTGSIEKPLPLGQYYANDFIPQ